jgi:hypothetical protein
VVIEQSKAKVDSFVVKVELVAFFVSFATTYITVDLESIEYSLVPFTVDFFSSFSAFPLIYFNYI